MALYLGNIKIASGGLGDGNVVSPGETIVKNLKLNFLTDQQYNDAKNSGLINDDELYLTTNDNMRESIFYGDLRGGQSITLEKHKRFLGVYAYIIGLVSYYIIDTERPFQNQLVCLGSGCVTKNDSGTESDIYISSASFDLSTNEFTHTKTGYFRFSNNSYNARNGNPSYYIYQIDTFD